MKVGQLAEEGWACDFCLQKLQITTAPDTPPILLRAVHDWVCTPCFSTGLLPSPIAWISGCTGQVLSRRAFVALLAEKGSGKTDILILLCSRVHRATWPWRPCPHLALL